MTGGAGSERQSNGGRARAIASFVTWLIVAVFIWRIWRISWGHWQSGGTSDFYYFWDAGANVLSGHAERAYTTHASPAGSLWPLAYPPPLLLLVPPLALLPARISLIVWLGLTGIAYVLTSRQPARVALASPAVPYNVRWGQTGFLTSSILLGGLNWIGRRPLLSGAVLGCMVIKPTLAVLIPVALVAGRRWKAMCAAAASAGAQITLAAIVFGPNIYVAWWKSASHFTHWLVSGFWGWSELSSTYAFARWWGAASSVAFAAQALTAIIAALVVIQSWRKDWDSKTAVLAAATLLVPPYICAHDAVMMVGPLGWFAARSHWRAATLWLLLLLPWFNLIDPGRFPIDVSGLPDTTPIAAALSLVFLWQDGSQSGARSSSS